MIEGQAGLAPATLWVLAIAFFLAGPIIALAPLGMAPLLLAAAVFSVASERFRGRRWLAPPSQLLWISTVFSAWCAVSLLWDLNLGHGLRKLLDLVLVLAALAVLAAAGREASPRQQRLAAIALAAGMALGLVLLAVETTLDFPLYRALMGNSDPRLVDLVEAKRSVDALPLLVWPAALAVARLTRTWIAIVLAAAFAVACVKLTASSATLGMAVSLVVMGFTVLSLRWTRRVLAGATVLAFLGIVPLAIWSYDAGGTTSPLLKHSAQHRVEIWHFAAERVLERPLTGYGFNASRDIPNGGAVSAFLEPGKPIIPLHPHDGFLQIWLELGLPGAVLAALGLLFAIRATTAWRDRSARFALAGYAAAVIVAGLAFGVWQTWWMATMAFSAVTFTMIGRSPEHA